MTNSNLHSSDGLHKWWLDVRESEATRSPMSKDGTLESLKGVEGLKAELLPTLSTSELVAPMSQTTEEVSKTPERWRVLESEETANSSCCTLGQVSLFTTRNWMREQRQVQVGA